MATSAKDIRARISEADISGMRGIRINTMQDWKHRLQNVDALYRGDWAEVMPDETQLIENPHVMNMVQVGIDDIARLVTEAIPSVICAPDQQNPSAETAAELRAHIADTYWDVNAGESLVPRVAMDLAGAGCAFVASTVQDGEDYPCFHRIDPRFCYPDVVNGQLLDLLVVEEINWRKAAALFPDLGLDTDPTIKDKVVEIIHYYSKDECFQALGYAAQDGGYNVVIGSIKRWDPKGVLPVAFAQLDSFDGAFRGMFDQITGSLQTKNRLVKMVLEYMDELVYAPMESVGVLNPDEPPGPGAHYRLDPAVQGAGVRRVQPAGSSPEVFDLLEFLDREQRAGAGYPAARQGEISQSIASASFVASTQGQLTTTIKNIQRLIALLRVKLNHIAFFQDEMMLDFEKPLTVSIGTRKTYTPSKNIKGRYRSKVIYGAGAGLDRMQADVRVSNLLAAGLISHEDGMRQIDFISSPSDTARQITLEQTQNIMLQKFLAEAQQADVIQLVILQSQGLSLTQALEQLQQQAQQQPAPAPAEGQPMAPEGAAPPEQANPQGQEIAGGNAAVQPIATAPPPPIEEVMLRPRVG